MIWSLSRRIQIVQSFGLALALGGAGAFVVGMIGGVAGCSYLGDARPASPELRVAGSTSACFEAALPSVQRFYSGEASPEEVSSAWDCASDAVSSYLLYVRGDARDSYTAAELRKFFERNILGNVQVSDALLEQTMKLKRALLGGDAERITRDELRQAQAAMAVLKQETLNLLPYMKLITLTETTEAAVDRPEMIAGAARQTVISGQAISKLFGNAQGTYSLADAQTFLREIGELYVTRGQLSTGGWAGPTWLAGRISTISTLKAFFVRAPGDAIEASEWPSLVENAGRLYAVFVQYRYAIAGQDVLTGRGLAGLVSAFRDFFAALEAGVRNKPEGAIHWDVIDAFVAEVYRTEALDIPISQPVLRDLLRPMIERVFNWRASVESGYRGDPPCPEPGRPRPLVPQVPILRPGATARCEPLRGLTLAAVDQMRRDFMGWADMQRMWDDVEAQARKESNGRISFAEIARAWRRIPSEYAEHREELGSQMGFGAEDGGRSPRRARPLSYASGGTVIFDRDPTDDPATPDPKDSLDREAFSALNWKRLVIRAASRGFAADPQASRWSGFTRDEFHAFVVALRPTAIELRLLAPNDDTSWNSTFDEADAFMFSSDGNGLMSYDEGVDLISFALSGSKMSRVAYREMRANCAGYEPDDFNLPKLDLGCFQRRLRERFAFYYSAIPRWSRFAENLDRVNRALWPALTADIITAVRRPNEAPGKLESSDIDRMTMIVQYIESLFARFDGDGDGFLDETEAMLAFPTLKRLLREGADGSVTSDDDLRAVFTYLLAYGTKPSKVGYLRWRYLRSTEDTISDWVNWALRRDGISIVRADRARLMKIVANMKK